MNPTPTRAPSATPCRGVRVASGGLESSRPSLSSAALAAVIIPAATALQTPSQKSETCLNTSIGSAPKPVDRAVTQPYHHTWADVLPLT